MRYTEAERQRRATLIEAERVDMWTLAQLHLMEQAVNRPLTPDLFDVLCAADSQVRALLCHWLTGLPLTASAATALRLDMYTRSQLHSMQAAAGRPLHPSLVEALAASDELLRTLICEWLTGSAQLDLRGLS